jgi:hypothetical protein
MKKFMIEREIPKAGTWKGSTRQRSPTWYCGSRSDIQWWSLA